MPDLTQLQQNKDRILSTIKIKGPSLPYHIAKTLNTEPLFASALLAELKSEQKLLVSDMKVGSSPLYFIKGQESLLENFTIHLNLREKEAFNLLKEERVLQDEVQTPIIRVALRALKDFALPIRIRIRGETKLFWKHFLLQDNEVPQLIKNLTSPSQKLQTLPQPKQNLTSPSSTEKSLPIQSQSTVITNSETLPMKAKLKESARISTQQTTIASSGQDNQFGSLIKPTNYKTKANLRQQNSTESESPKPIPKKTKKPPIQHEFSRLIKSHLQNKDIELLSILSEKKREFQAKVRTDSPFGKQSYLLIAKDKKTITENDLTLALQLSQTEKMPALILSPASLNKKAALQLKLWNNLIKYEKIQ
jgi:hypothetical protein